MIIKITGSNFAREMLPISRKTEKCITTNWKNKYLKLQLFRNKFFFRTLLTHFCSIFLFCIPWKHQKTNDPEVIKFLRRPLQISNFFNFPVEIRFSVYFLYNSQSFLDETSKETGKNTYQKPHQPAYLYLITKWQGNTNKEKLNKPWHNFWKYGCLLLKWT